MIQFVLLITSFSMLIHTYQRVDITFLLQNKATDLNRVTQPSAQV